MFLNSRGTALADSFIGLSFFVFLATIGYLVADSILSIFCLLYI